MLTFVTGNLSKAEQLRLHLHSEVTHKKIDLDEIQSLSLEEVVKHKVMEAYRHIQGPVLVEDTSLVFEALGQLPGPLIKWFLQELDNEGLCALLTGFQSRKATAEVLFGYYDGKVLKTFRGKMQGIISEVPKGERGFGWDPIFIPEGYSKTWGEMTMDEQITTSMRKQALHELGKYLN